jgi:hypothetical protein
VLAVSVALFALAAAGASAQTASPAPKLEPQEEVRQALGSLALSAQLDGVEVWLGDQRLGETCIGRALIVNNVPIGTHRLVARKDGHKEWVREVQVMANQRLEVVIDIETLAPEGFAVAPIPVVGERWETRIRSTTRTRGAFVSVAESVTDQIMQVSGVGSDSFTVRTTQSTTQGSKNTLYVSEGRYSRDWGFVSHGTYDESTAKVRNNATWSTLSGIAFDFPLLPGKRWQHRRVSGSGMTALSFDEEKHVLGWETLTVPAGTFEALRIESKTIIGSAGGAPVRTMTTINSVSWYAPAMGLFPVRHEMSQSSVANGKPSSSAMELNSTWELVKYARP